MKYDRIARDDILALSGYVPGAQIRDTIRLNANEAPQAPLLAGGAPAGGAPLNRYPEVHPLRLRTQLAGLLDVDAANLLVTRGSSEAIDVLIRAFCRAYRDTLLTTPPTFDMYRFYADIQGVQVMHVPLTAADNFALPLNAIVERCDATTKLVFICSPNNPTGTVTSRQLIVELAAQLENQCIVVIDEAYVEFSDAESLASVATQSTNLVVLRTLSKAHALAGVRCGAAIANFEIINLLQKVLPPYSFATPVIDCVMQALTEERLAASAIAVNTIIEERSRVLAQLQQLPVVDRCWPSQANFILTRFFKLREILEKLIGDGILIRDVSNMSGLENCARITIGTQDENDKLLAALSRTRSKP